MEYSISFISKILELDQFELVDLKDFITELRNISKQKTFRRNDFLAACGQKEYLSNKRLALYRHSDIVKKYGSIINKLKFSDILIGIVSFILSSNDDYESIYHLFDHILQKYNKKEEIKLNLQELSKLGIKNIEFLHKPKEIEHVNNYSCAVTVIGDKKTKNYELSSFYSDGKLTWEKSPTIQYIGNSDDAYSAKANHASYIIHYTKTKTNCLIRTPKFTRLDFDRTTLPTYDELYNSDVWQKLGDDRTDALDNINLLIETSNDLDKIVEKIKNRLTILSGQPYYKETLEEISKLIKMLNNLSVITTNEYKKKEVITEDDFQYIKNVK